MKQYYKVKRWIENEGCHICENGDGYEEKIDLMVSGDLPFNVTPTSLIDSTVSCRYTYPYISIAIGVKIEGDEND